jgi:hypothetical protein
VYCNCFIGFTRQMHLSASLERNVRTRMTVGMGTVERLIWRREISRLKKLGEDSNKSDGLVYWKLPKWNMNKALFFIGLCEKIRSQYLSLKKIFFLYFNLCFD